MNIINFGDRCAKPVILCLGRYESLHLGHVSITNSAKKIADSVGAEVMLMTFDERDNPRFRQVILNFTERLKRLEELKVTNVLRIDFTPEFMALSAEEFLNVLENTLNIKGIACGFDFRFGAGRAGGHGQLKEFCNKHNVPLAIAEEVCYNGEKISSTAIKNALKDGDVLSANAMLGYNYSFCGMVIEGRKDGRKMGFPTANIIWQKDKYPIKTGVYKTFANLSGKEYKGITNFGAAPTFDFESVLTETYFARFTGDLYGKTVCVKFENRIRDTVKFSSINDLKTQLEKDKKLIED